MLAGPLGVQTSCLPAGAGLAEGVAGSAVSQALAVLATMPIQQALIDVRIFAPRAAAAFASCLNTTARE